VLLFVQNVHILVSLAQLLYFALIALSIVLEPFHQANVFAILLIMMME